MASKARTLPKKLALSATSVLVVFGVLELVSRASEPGPFSLFDTFPYFDSEVDGHWRHVPGFEGRWDSTWYEIDERGLRGTAAPAAANSEDEVSVVCLGDSCTFGKGVLERDSWPRQLETMLLGEGAPARVFNLGINGAYGEVYANVLAEHVDALQPDYVVVGYNLNDFPNAIRKIDEQVFGDRGLRRVIPQSVRDGLGRLALYRWVRAAYYDRNRAADMRASEALAGVAGAEDPSIQEAWREEREHLARIQSLAAERGARTIVFLFPYESQVLLDDYDRTPIERIRGVCDALGLPFVDLAEVFRAEARSAEPLRSLFIKGDRYHPNADGYGIVAAHVREEIRRLGD